ncbi:hypothetical protein N7520_000044 [Penicillium odoratum]|uniref:uncharacterized protein n=1 Tax=Penicillium odoratum TaxID=1167516 RepID=UPI0025490093|nr:uncharacterized protein N7520_000044 [Penicillium odoratum]KAJ5776798.1 hypothetical protein N7520_000044 [Penicillium odoratum]
MAPSNPHETLPAASGTRNTCTTGTAATCQGPPGIFNSVNLKKNMDAETGLNTTIGLQDKDASAKEQATVSPQDCGNSLSERQWTRAQAIETYITKVCHALMIYGAPTHRLERYAHHTAQALGLQLQSFYMPGCMMISFSHPKLQQGGVQIIRCVQQLNLSKLYDVRCVYKNVIHEKTTVEDASILIDEIANRPEQFPTWIRVFSYGLASAFVGPVSYNAQPIDLPIIFVLGTLIGFSELVLVPRSELYGYVFEIFAAILASFLGRVFGSLQWGQGQGFCFSAISQASIVMILPGFTITSSALELQSRNMVSGAVRMVYGIVYTLFLSLGFLIGISIYGAIDETASSATTCSTTYGVWWPIIFVIPFTFCYIIVQNGKWNTMPPMLGFSLAGWAVNHFSSENFGDAQPLSQALGALTVGVLANLYARIEHGLAATLMHPAIYVQVPGSLAASGSLISGLAIADQITRNGTNKLTPHEALVAQLDAGYTMVSIGVAITVGLSVSVLLVYPLRQKGRSGIFSY